MAAPGRACSRQTTEVNFPDIVENSFTQQEETKPSFRDSKNRLLLSQVAYFQNYQLKTDKDGKDDDEEQKYRDRKNKLFLSQVAYYLGCRHKTEVPGFLCCAQKVNMVASGRPPFRINREVNVPEGIEKSGSQQEENKPNVGASKNRLLLSQVAYFQNYRMKTDDDREDHDEQKYRDSKNKLLMSQVAYYLACRLRMKVPGFLYCYPNSRVDSGKLPSRKDPELNVPEAIEKSCSQREDNKPDVGVKKNGCLLSEVNYSLNYRLRTYAGEDDDEERRYGDSKKKLLVSRVVYSLACQLTTEVPGFPCSAPNVITVASGRAVAGRIPGVNVPEAIEKSCSRREDNKPDVGVRRNRCLLSEVDYSLNYGLRAYDAREDDDEERRYGDSKKKLLVSRVVYSLACQLTTEVPGFPCSAPNVITVASGRAVAGRIPGVNVPEAIEKSCSRREDNKPDVGVRRNRCLLSEVDYSLNYGLRAYDAREDDDEERRYGDSKKKLLVSRVVYSLACQLTTEVPGFPCSAPNVITVASGRAVAGRIPGVNVPEAIEKSCSRREDNKPDVGVRRNRCLLSEVDYSLNYGLRAYDAREDDDEERRYGDSKKKLLVSRVVYSLACQLTTEVPGFPCSAPNVITVASGRAVAGRIPGVNVPEAIEKSCSRREDNKPDVGVRRNRCLLSEVDYSLNYGLRAYDAREDDDEERRYGDSKKKLLVSRVVYSLACQLTTEVPGFPCSAPNVITVASGRAVAGRIPGVNVPEAIEKSCSRREDNKPDVGVRRNRCLLSEVDYSLNYGLRAYDAREDDDEERRYGDSKKKLLVSRVVYSLACQLTTEVPGFPCSAPNVITVASGRAVAGRIPGVNVPEAIEKSCSRREDNKPDVGVRRNRCLLSEVDYSLNYGLRAYDAREDDDEERRYGDSKKKLLVSRVVYSLACQLTTEVPGFPCSAPNVITVASGRAVAGRIPGVNVPEAIEKSCSRREDNKPDVGVRRNRCLLSEVDYSLNYGLRAYDAREDDDEERRYGDSKKKLLVSRVVYSLACQLTTEVPGFPCSAPNVITVASGRAVAGRIPGVNVPEAIEKSCSRREDNKPDVGVRRNRCLLSEVDYSLNYGLRAYDAREDDDEERRYGDSKKKLLVSRVVYSLACQLTTEVPGFPCSAPNVITVASGRAVAGRIPGVNVPEAIEKSCSRREDNKPDVGVRRNRCLLSEVDYSLNYGLRAYDAREDDDEERRYGDSKKKLLVSRVVYSLACQLTTEVPGFPCSAPNVITVASGRAVAGRIPGVNVPEAIEKSCSRREDNKPDVGVRRNRCLLSEVDYSLNYGLRAYDAREDDDEERRYGDSKKKLLVSRVVYSLACQLTTEVPGFPCSAPNVITVASGRAVAGRIPGVNVPEAIEKSCSRREDNKPDVGVRRNRCLLSEVDYSLNYGLRAYGDQGYNEKRKYRDSKNKHLTSQAAFCLGSRLKSKIPGFLCCTQKVNMVASGRTPFRINREVNVPEGIEKSGSQQEENKPNVGASKNRLLLSQVAYFQNYRMKTDDDQEDHDEEQKYRDSKNKLVISQVACYLACRLRMKVPGFLYCYPNISRVDSGKLPSRKDPEVNVPEAIEKSCSQREDNKPDVGVRQNRCLLSEVNYSLNYQLRAYGDQDYNEKRKYREKKNKHFTSQAAFCLGSRLKTKVPGFLCSAPNVHMVASGRPSRINPEVNVPEGTEKFCSQQEENKPNAGTTENRLLLSQVAYFQNYRLKSYKDRKGHDEEQKYRDRKKKLVMSQVAYYLCCRHKTEVPGFLLSASNISKVASGRPPYRKYTEVNVPEGIEKSCSQQENNKPNVPVSKNRCLLSEANYSLNCRLKTYNDQKDHDEEQKCRDSKNKHLRSQAAYYLDCRLKTEGSQGDVEEEEEKGPVPPRNLQESVEEEAPQESWDEGDSTLSVPPGPSAFNETLRSNFHSLEDQQVISAVDIDSSAWSWWKQKNLKSSGTHWMYCIQLMQLILSFISHARLTHMLFFICGRVCSLVFGHGQ
ncbi:uncharacterized protein LOC128930164 isoform X2 [Callithrix jacchus]